MSTYTDVNPQQVIEVTGSGTEISKIAALGNLNYIAPDRRLPCFVGLAKELGGTYAENLDGMTIEEGLAAGGLNYHVDLIQNVETTMIRPTGIHRVTFPASRGTVAVHPDGTHVGLGMVGRRYKRIQNEQVAELGQAIMDEAGATMVAAGSFGDPRGSRTYMAFKLPESIVIGDNEDTTDRYLTLLNHHNGQGGLSALIGPIRGYCTNQGAGIFGGKKNRFTLTHSGDTTVKIADVHSALKIESTWAESYAQTLNEWLTTPMSEAALDAWLAKVLATPVDATEVGDRNWARKRLDCKQVIREHPTNEFGRGTYLAAYNGLVETLDHFWPTQSPDQHESAVSRFSRVMRGGELERLKTTGARLLGVAG